MLIPFITPNISRTSSKEHLEDLENSLNDLKSSIQSTIDKIQCRVYMVYCLFAMFISVIVVLVAIAASEMRKGGSRSSSSSSSSSSDSSSGSSSDNTENEKTCNRPASYTNIFIHDNSTVITEASAEKQHDIAADDMEDKLDQIKHQMGIRYSRGLTLTKMYNTVQLTVIVSYIFIFSFLKYVS